MDGDAKYMYSSVCISGLATRTADAGVLLYTNYKKKNLNTILQLNYMNTKHRPTVLQQHPRRVLRTWHARASPCYIESEPHEPLISIVLHENDLHPVNNKRLQGTDNAHRSRNDKTTNSSEHSLLHRCSISNSKICWSHAINLICCAMCTFKANTPCMDSAFQQNGGGGHDSQCHT